MTVCVLSDLTCLPLLGVGIKSWYIIIMLYQIRRRLIHRIRDLQITGKTIIICWIPFHIGIQGNDSADAAAKGASEEPIPMNDSDWRNVIRMHYL